MRNELSLMKRESRYHELKRGNDWFYEGIGHESLLLIEEKHPSVEQIVSPQEGLLQHLKLKVMPNSFILLKQHKFHQTMLNFPALNQRHLRWTMRTHSDALPNS